MELEYVNVFQLEPFKGILDGGKDSLSDQLLSQPRGSGTETKDTKWTDLSTGSSVINQSRRT
jgi:hypothetical protein